MSDTVQQIKDRLNILDVISPYVELHKAGKNFKGKSPFSNEKTPSFYVSPERGMYYCFSTSQGGDMFTFIQAMEGVDFKGALKILADKARVEITPVSPEKQNQRDRLYALLEDTASFYVEQLKLNHEAADYLKGRGVLADTIASWRIGYAPGPPLYGWRTTKEYLLGRGFSETEIILAGLAKTAEGGKEAYDVFRHRVMFPLFDQSGRVVAFSGRTLERDTNSPKYVNSPETELFKKSELLYGYDRAKHGIRQLDFSLLVEGQFDVVMSHQAGYHNAVAVSGTALTPHHVQLLERLSPKVVLALDSDKAGIAAAKRAADIMLRRGLDVKVARLVMKDPADLVREDPKAFKKAIGASVHVIEWLMDQLLTKDLPPRTRKLQAREEVLPFVALLQNRIDQDHFEQLIASALGTTQAAVHYEVERILENKSDASVATTARGRVAAGQSMSSGEPLTTISKPTVSRTAKLQAYLLGVRPLFSPTVAARIGETVAGISGLSLADLETLATVEVQAEVLFRVEADQERQSRLAFESAVLHALNQLRTLIAKERVAGAKIALAQAELDGDEVKIKEALSLVEKAQHSLREPPYESNFLVVTE